jgi:hypothetical protein
VPESAAVASPVRASTVDRLSRNSSAPGCEIGCDPGIRSIKTAYNGLLWAMERQLRRTHETVSGEIRALRKDIECEFGVRPA